MTGIKLGLLVLKTQKKTLTNIDLVMNVVFSYERGIQKKRIKFISLCLSE